MRTSNRLTAVAIAKKRSPGLYADGGGLYLQVSKWKTKSWVFRYMRDKRARKMGLGPVDVVTLADARERAREARKVLAEEGDPIEARLAARQERRAQAAKLMTFKQCADGYIKDHESTWRNEKHRAQWASTLDTYVHPIIGALPVASVDKPLVLKILRPIWHTKIDTAKRVRGRIETILDWATVHDFRAGENPARWKGLLDKALPAPDSVRQVRHQPALPFDQIPQFMVELRQRAGIRARALECTILTALRTDAVIGARWPEINIAEKIWTIPGTRMKRKSKHLSREHKVPLSDRVIEILSSLPREEGTDYVFLGAKTGAPLSNMAMLELMRDMRPGFVPHGFRSTFKDWASETTAHPDIVVEMALGHVISDQVEAAYRRGELLVKRGALMSDWAEYCARIVPAKQRAA